MASRFPLLRCNLTRDQLIAEAAALLCNVDSSLVEDIFPCTPWQQACLTRATDAKETRLSRYQWELPKNVQQLRFKAAVEAVIASTPVLRTRIARLPDGGLVNVVVRPETISWTETTLLETCITAGELVISARSAGIQLSRYGFVKADDGSAYFVWALHPAIHDDRTLCLVLKDIEQSYRGLELATLLPFPRYREFVQTLDEGAAMQFWKAQLRGPEAVSFPVLAENASNAQVDKHLQHSVTGELKIGTDHGSAAATVWMAWAMLTARYTDSDDAVFGSTLSGRQAELPGIERIAGPTTCLVPVRTTVRWQSTVTEFRQQMQRQAQDMAPYAHYGMQSAVLDADRVLKLTSLIVVNATDDVQDDSSTIFTRQPDGMAAARCCGCDQYALVLAFQVHAQGVRLDIRFDSSILQERVAQRMLEQLGHVLRLLCSPSHGDCKLSELEMASPQDLRDIWSWNPKVPAPVYQTVHTVIAETTVRQPDAPAICAWDGKLTYTELDEVSTRLAYCIIDLGISAGSIVPLCFEKSMWTAVAMLAVMKAGAACVALDLSNPLLRLKTIVAKYNRKLILCSRTNETTARSLDFASVFIVAADSIPPPQTATPAKLPQVSPSQTVFITYTSGSTGTPKGTCISHANVCAASHYQGYPLGFRTTSRVLDFAPYSFDVAWSNVLHTLCAGGCLCVASTDEMMDDIDETLSLYRVNFINITPSALRALTPSGSPLQDILLSGERPNGTLLSQWLDGPCIKNTYGPAECTFKSAFATISVKNVQSPDIGRPVGACGWLVCPERDDRLAMIGQVGELLIEGPLVGQGYWGDEAATSAAFIQDPPWLLRGGPGIVGRRGRLYKTGDLMRYNADGTLQFVGRKDAQVKIRGQRVELGEVEHHVQKHLATKATPGLPFAAELITPQGSQNAMLVVFLAVPRSEGDLGIGTNVDVRERMLGLDEKLADVLPSYMIPSAYIPIEDLPMTGTGKINRRELRRIGSTLTLQQLLAAR